MNPDTFRQRFLSVAQKLGPLCVGCDPSPELLARWGLPCTAEGLAVFCDTVAESVRDVVAVVKPQIAFFEPFGPEGMSVLQSFVRRVREQRQLVIIDCKRNDIGHSVSAYARAFIGPHAPYSTDAVTANAYLGFDSLAPLFDEAESHGACVFVVVRSSNPEGAIVQSARVASGVTLAEHLAERTAARNGHDRATVGAVVGATLTEGERMVTSKLDKALMLVPGVGAQGASFADIARSFGDAKRFAIPSVSRAFLEAGPDLHALRRKAIQLSREALDALST